MWAKSAESGTKKKKNNIIKSISTDENPVGLYLALYAIKISLGGNSWCVALDKNKDIRTQLTWLLADAQRRTHRQQDIFIIANECIPLQQIASHRRPRHRIVGIWLHGIFIYFGGMIWYEWTEKWMNEIQVFRFMFLNVFVFHLIDSCFCGRCSVWMCSRRQPKCWMLEIVGLNEEASAIFM